ncbi:MAG: glucose-1-phosphate thymidylyltransferase [Bdellovibrionales bacterium]
MSKVNHTLFFTKVPAKLESLFDNNLPVWNILKEDLKNFFKNQPKENVILGDVSPGAHLEGEQIYIEKGARVEHGAFIKGPCYIGAGTEVRHGAYLRGNVFVGENCVVGHSTEVKHSIFFDGAKAGHFNYIGDSILGNNINLGAGTKLANLKMIPGVVKVKIDGESVDTGLKKFGAILGDSTETGCNSVLNPGTVLAQKSLVFPNASAHGVHLKRAKVTK